MATCPNCHRDLPEDSRSGQCPHCGHAWAAEPPEGARIPDGAKVEVGYGARKSWLEQWGLVERSYKKVQNLHAGTDNQEALTAVKDFFIHSRHLGDWLVDDAETSVKHEDIDALLQSEPDLQVCNALANTSQHRTPDRADAISARISPAVTQPQGQVTVENSTTRGTETRDALELATSCMGIWRKFLLSHGLRI